MRIYTVSRVDIKATTIIEADNFNILGNLCVFNLSGTYYGPIAAIPVSNIKVITSVEETEKKKK